MGMMKFKGMCGETVHLDLNSIEFCYPVRVRDELSLMYVGLKSGKKIFLDVPEEDFYSLLDDKGETETAETEKPQPRLSTRNKVGKTVNQYLVDHDINTDKGTNVYVEFYCENKLLGKINAHDCLQYGIIDLVPLRFGTYLTYPPKCFVHVSKEDEFKVTQILCKTVELLDNGVLVNGVGGMSFNRLTPQAQAQKTVDDFLREANPDDPIRLWNEGRETPILTVKVIPEEIRKLPAEKMVTTGTIGYGGYWLLQIKDKENFDKVLEVSEERAETEFKADTVGDFLSRNLAKTDEKVEFCGKNCPFERVDFSVGEIPQNILEFNALETTKGNSGTYYICLDGYDFNELKEYKNSSENEKDDLSVEYLFKNHLVKPTDKVVFAYGDNETLPIEVSKISNVDIMKMQAKSLENIEETYEYSTWKVELLYIGDYITIRNLSAWGDKGPDREERLEEVKTADPNITGEHYYRTLAGCLDDCNIPNTDFVVFTYNDDKTEPYLIEDLQQDVLGIPVGNIKRSESDNTYEVKVLGEYTLKSLKKPENAITHDFGLKPRNVYDALPEKPCLTVGDLLDEMHVGMYDPVKFIHNELDTGYYHRHQLRNSVLSMSAVEIKEIQTYGAPKSYEILMATKDAFYELQKAMYGVYSN